MKKNLFIGLPLILAAMNANAGYQIAKTKIEYLQTYDGYAVVTLTESGPNSENCAKSNAGRYVALDMSNGKGDTMYSAVMAAMMADNKVGFGASGCYEWGGGIPKAYRVDSYPN